jgi:hypothetical protein
MVKVMEVFNYYRGFLDDAGTDGSDIGYDIYSAKVDAVFYLRAISRHPLAHEITIIATLINRAKTICN